MNPTNAAEDFRTKYTSSGRIGGMLIDGFFAAIDDLLTPHRDRIRRVLEVGAGEGFSTERLRAMLPPAVHYEASELLPEQVIAARARNPGIPVREESVYALQRETASFDLVICLEVLEHLEDPETALAELTRVSAGLVLVSVPREPLWCALNMARGKYWRHLGNTPGHIQHWSSGGLRRLVNRHAEVVALRRPLPWTIALARRA